MKKRLITTIIALMSVSLVGIILVQLLWIRNAFEVKEAQFNQHVNEAMLHIVEKLQTQDAVLFISDRINPTQNPRVQTFDSYSFVDQALQDSLMKDIVIVVSKNGSSKKTLAFNSDSVTDKFIREEEVEMNTWISSNDIDGMHFSTNQNDEDYLYTHLSDTVEIAVVRQKGSYLYRIKKMDKVLKQLTYEYITRDDPLEHRLDLDGIQIVIDKEFESKGLPAHYEFAISNSEGGKPRIKSRYFSENDTLIAYQTSLLPNDIFNTGSKLLISFPKKDIHIFKSILFLLVASVFFTLVILSTFAVTIWIILRQKKLSEVKSDFINNITHEFKTPIATISLAADSIGNPKVLANKDHIKYYTGIIKEENKRMNTQVEHILRMSLIDKNDLKIKMCPQDVHQLIKRAVKNISLQVKKIEGSIDLQLHAKNYTALLNEIHFINVLYNLLDNALKYSIDPPVIEIRTTDNDGRISIEIEDHGMGMDKETQRKIFDKFYRVSSGDIHNVKGFGLGLAYVKAIIQAFKGQVKVKSEPDKGTKFIITLPLCNNE